VPDLEPLSYWALDQNLYLRLPPSLPNLPDIQTSRTDLKEIEPDNQTIQELFRKELTREVQSRPGYRPDDRIGPFRLILEPFSIENGMMTQTLKIRRPVVMERYRNEIDEMFG